MRKGAITCGEDASIRQVAQIMAVQSARYCVVINDNHEVLGIISARTILTAFGKDLDATRAAEVLIPHPLTVTANTPLKEAIHLMDKRKVEHLVVVSGYPGRKAVLGMLHVEDIVGKMTADRKGDQP